MSRPRAAALSLLPFLVPAAPAPGLFRTKARARDLECERLELEAALVRYPGEIAPARPRGDYMERGALVCRERLLRRGLRDPRDEAILTTLQTRAEGWAAAAADLRPDLAARTWLVDANYEHAQVVPKLRFAAQNALVAAGLSVSDRTPRLAVGDVDVLTRLPPARAYPAACARYAANGSLGPGDALLMVVSRDPQATMLHAGLCADGRWTWLR